MQAVRESSTYGQPVASVWEAAFPLADVAGRDEPGRDGIAQAMALANRARGARFLGEGSPLCYVALKRRRYIHRRRWSG
jgi:hypothetical protein